MAELRTIDEFKAAATAHRRRLAAFAGVGVAGLLAMMIVAVVIRETAEQTARNRLGDVGYEILMFSLIGGGMIVFFIGIWLGERSGHRDPRLHCPHCGAMLADARSIVIASRNCVKCGRRVLAEPES